MFSSSCSDPGLLNGPVCARVLSTLDHTEWSFITLCKLSTDFYGWSFVFSRCTNVGSRSSVYFSPVLNLSPLVLSVLVQLPVEKNIRVYTFLTELVLNGKGV